MHESARRRIGGASAILAAFLLAGASPARAATNPAAADPRPHPSWVGHGVELCRGAARDFRRLPSAGNLLGLGIGSGLSLAAHGRDRDILDRLSASDRLEDALSAGKWIGSEALLLPATLCTYAVGHWGERPALERTADELLRAQVLSQTLTLGLKVTTRRSRPDAGGLSFPSSHASASFAVATVLEERCGWKVGLPAFALATGVAVSRVTERRHWPSDVVFGATLGIVSGRTVMIAAGDGRCALAPVAWPDGAGIALVWQGASRRRGRAAGR